MSLFRLILNWFREEVRMVKERSCQKEEKEFSEFMHRLLDRSMAEMMRQSGPAPSAAFDPPDPPQAPMESIGDRERLEKCPLSKRPGWYRSDVSGLSCWLESTENHIWEITNTSALVSCQRGTYEWYVGVQCRRCKVTVSVTGVPVVGEYPPVEVRDV